jgi:hypothetical protein
MIDILLIVVALVGTESIDGTREGKKGKSSETRTTARDDGR